MWETAKEEHGVFGRPEPTPWKMGQQTIGRWWEWRQKPEVIGRSHTWMVLKAVQLHRGSACNSVGRAFEVQIYKMIHCPVVFKSQIM